VTCWAYAYEYVYLAPFPGNYWCLFWCGVVYFILDFFFVVIDYYILDDIFFSSKPPDLVEWKGISFISIGSKLPHFEHNYSLTLYVTYSAAPKSPPKELMRVSENYYQITKPIYVGNMFTDEGNLFHKGVEKEIMEILTKIK
jgi:hypothetical protein